MTTVKRPSQEQRSAVLKVVFLLVAVLGAAFLLFKHDPYTAAVLDKDAGGMKKEAESSLRQRNDNEPPKAALSAAGAELSSRTFVIDLASLKEGKTGQIVLETRPEWAPLGVQRLHDLMDEGFYKDCKFFRVVNNFMVQFGIQGVPGQFPMAKIPFKDDPVIQTNAYGTLTFATSGPNSRTTQLFINTNKKGNKFLDGQGFAPIANIVSGMEFVDQIYSEYGEKPNQGKIQNRGNEYLNKEFPNLSFVQNVK